MGQGKLNSLKPSQAVATELLQRAAFDPRVAVSSLAELYRAYVKDWARMQISPAMRQRFQSSTVAQESLIRIQAQGQGFECRSLPEFENYLLKTVRAVISDLRRRHLAEKRSLLREVWLEELESGIFWNAMRCLSLESPYTLAAEQDERLRRLERVRAALLRIEPHYRKLIISHFISGNSIADIAATLERSKKATRMLITRALRALKAAVDADGGTTDG